MKKKIFGKIPLWMALTGIFILVLGGTAACVITGKIWLPDEMTPLAGLSLISEEEGRALLKSDAELSPEEEQDLLRWLSYFLATDKEAALEMGRELPSAKGFEVGGKKTITGEGAFLFPEGNGGSAFKLKKGASFSLEGIRVDGNDKMGVGFNVEDAGELALKGVDILGVTEFGVFTSGKTEISDVTIEGSNTWMRFRKGAEGNITNVNCFRSGNVGILVEKGAVVNIDGDDTVLEKTNNNTVKNEGTFTMNRGELLFSNGYSVENFGTLSLTGVKMDSSRTGGSVMNENGAEAVLKDCTFWNNKYHVQNSGNMTMSGCSLNSSTSPGVYNNPGGVLDISDTSIYKSSQGIYNDRGTVNAKNIVCEMMNTNGITNRGKDAAFKIDGLEVDMCTSGINNIKDDDEVFGTVDAKNVTVSRASSYNAVSYGGNLNLADCTFNPSEGYSVYVREGAAVLDSVRILGTLTEGKGGISVGSSDYQDVQVTLRGNTEITGCASRGIINYGKLTIYDCNIHNNNTSGKIDNGVAIRSVGTVTMYGGKIHDNTAKDYGGAICLSQLEEKKLIGKLYIHGGAIYNNRAGKNGGAIYTALPENVIEMSGGAIYDNRAEGRGDAILLRGTMKLSNAESFKDNDICLLGDAGLIEVTSGNLSFDEVKLTTNSYSYEKTLVTFPDGAAAENLVGKFSFRNNQFSVAGSGAAGVLVNQVRDFDEAYNMGGAQVLTVTTFGQLKEAVESTSADTSREIRIGADIVLTDEIVQPAWTDIRLVDDGAPHTLMRGSNGTLFTVGKDCHLIFAGNAGLTLDGGAQSGRVAEKAMISTGIFGCFVMEDGAVLRNAYNAGTSSDTGVRGAAVCLGSDSRFLMRGGKIENCSSPTDETYDNSYCAVYVATSCGASIKGGSIENCGDRAIFSFGKAYMSGGTIDGCSHMKYGGAAIRGPVFVMTGGTIQNCVSTNSGSAVYILPSGMVPEGYFKLDGGTIKGNLVGTKQSTNANGGAVYISKECKFDFLSGSVSENEAGDEFVKMSTGGINNAGETYLGKGAKVVGNVATLSRAGIYNTGTLTIDGALIAENRSTNIKYNGETYGSGAGIFNQGTLVMDGAEVKNNYLGTTGTIYGSKGDITLKNMTFTGNTLTDAKGNYKGIDLRVAKGTNKASLSGKIVAVETDQAFRLDLDKTFVLEDDFSKESKIKLYLDGKIYKGRKVLEGKVSEEIVNNCFEWTNVRRGYFIGKDGRIDSDLKEARIGETVYSTLEDAVEAAKAGDTIELINEDPINLEKQLKITKPITITTDGSTDREINSSYGGWYAIDLQPGEGGKIVLCGQNENSRLIINGESDGTLTAGEDSPDDGREEGMEEESEEESTGLLRVGPMVRCGNNKAGNTSFEYVTFRNCSSSYAGSALYVAGAEAEVKNCLFENNTTGYKAASGAGGAAIYCAATGEVSVTGSEFKKNTAANGSGGAVYSTGVIKLENAIFEGNVSQSATGGGGAVFVSGSKEGVSINSCTFKENKAETKNGGALYLKNAAAMEGNTFTENEAKEGGGAVYLDSGDNAIIIGKNSFEKNKAGSYGGAVCNSGKGDFEVNESTFTGNEANQGGAVYATNVRSNPVVIDGSKFAENTSGSGGAVYIASENKLHIKDSVFKENTSNKVGGGAVCMGTSTSDMVLSGKVVFEENKDVGSSKNNSGGGAVRAGKSFVIEKGADVTFTNNESNTKGGAVYMLYNGVSAFTLEEEATLTMSGNKDSNGSYDIAAREETDGKKALEAVLNGSYAIEGIYGAEGTTVTLGSNAESTLTDGKRTVLKLTGNVAENTQVVFGSSRANEIFEAECENRDLVLNKDGYLITKPPVELNGKYYETLNEAYNAAKAGDTIKLVGNVTLDKALKIDKSVTIATDELSRTITVIPENNDTIMFEVNGAECIVKLQGTAAAPLVIEGTGTPYGKMLLYFGKEYKEASLEHVTVRNANRSNGAGAAIFHEKALTLKDCTFENCNASTDGGAIRGNGALTAEGCTFTNCKAETKAGGAIYCNGDLTLNGCTFTGCSAGTDGGAVQVVSKHTVKIQDSTFNKNAANGGCGGAVGIGTYDSTLTLLGSCRFTGNTAKGNSDGTLTGGAILAPINLTVGDGSRVTEVIMTGNECTGFDHGDAICFRVEKPTFTIKDNAILYVYNNPREGDTDIDICNKNGDKITPKVELGGLYKSGDRQALEVNGICYDTLNEAYSAAEAGDTIKLIGDVTLDTRLLIEKSVTIATDGSQRTITVKPENDSTIMFEVNNADCEVYLKGTAEAPLIIEGTGKQSYGKMLLYFGKEYKEASLEHVTVRNAYRKGGAGGAIFHENPLTLTDCTFENCKADNGGAIRGNGKLEATNCTFTDCTTNSTANTYGGAIYAGGALELNGCTFTDCTTNSTTNTYGGAIYAGGALELNGCTFVDCAANSTANACGGAIYAKGTELITKNSSFTKCTANQGGAIYKATANGTFDCIGCTFETNEAKANGGAVYVASTHTVKIQDSIFKDNKALGSYGGAVSIGTKTSTLQLLGSCRFTGNTAKGTAAHAGGAILAPKTLTVGDGSTATEVIMTGNECTGCNHGDAISMNADSTEAKLTVENHASLYVYNNPEEGDEHPDICYMNGGVFDEKKHLVVKEGGCYKTGARQPFEVNGICYDTLNEAYEAAEAGDTIKLVGDVTLDKALKINKSVTIATDGLPSTITVKPNGNTRMFEVDGAECIVKLQGTAVAPLVIEGTGETPYGQMLLYFGKNYQEASLEYVTVRNAYRYSETSAVAGAAIFHEKALTLTNCTFENCKASYGGAVRGNGDLEATNCTFTNCTGSYSSNSTVGGGAISNNNAAVKLTGCTFDGCTIGHSGGAIYAGKELTLDRCTFTNCKADNGTGGAVYASGAKFEAINSSFTNCKADNGTGGAIYCSKNLTTPMTMDGCTFTECGAKTNGGAVYTEGKAFTAENSSFAKCEANVGGAIYKATEGTFDCTGCTFEENIAREKSGAVHVGSKHTVTIRDSKFNNNEARGGYGGAVGIGTASSNLTLLGNCEWVGNKAAGTDKYKGGAMLAPATLTVGDGSTETVVIITENDCTGYDFGDAISMNATASDANLTVKSEACLYVRNNPDETNEDRDICDINGDEITVNVEEGGTYIGKEEPVLLIDLSGNDVSGNDVSGSDPQPEKTGDVSQNDPQLPGSPVDGSGNDEKQSDSQGKGNGDNAAQPENSNSGNNDTGNTGTEQPVTPGSENTETGTTNGESEAPEDKKTGAAQETPVARLETEVKPREEEGDESAAP